MTLDELYKTDGPNCEQQKDFKKLGLHRKATIFCKLPR
jgi:hypothetical protein